MSAATSRTVLAPISRARGEAKPGPDAPASQLDELAAQIEAGFRDAAALAIREAHGAGVPVAVLNGAGRPAWLHPDGTVRPTNADPVPHS